LEPIVRRSFQRLVDIVAFATVIAGPVAAAAQAGASTRLAASDIRPNRFSPEYLLSWGVAASRAESAYRRGATGEGVIVAMIDTGVDEAAAAMFSHLAPASTDLVPRRQLDTGDRHHGEQTASLLAGRVDGAGTFGMAYEATLLSIRADRDGSCLRICAFDPATLAQAIDYAVDHGARVIGMPMASKRPIPAIEAALERATESGAIIVAAAGNDGGAQPTWPALYAADPRFQPSMIVTGASTPRGQLADWSNKAGSAKDRYVAAPGERVVVDCGTRECSLVSGTSYSVAYTAGALALLLSRDPTLSGKDAAKALLTSADDLAQRGVDDLTGRGRLNVGRAMRSLNSRPDDLSAQVG
jgi:subtilisin family serine protease